MGILQKVEDKIQGFVVHKAAANAAIFIGKAAASYALAHSGVLSRWGVSASVDPNAVAAAVGGVLHMGIEWLASKCPSLSWLHTS